MATHLHTHRYREARTTRRPFIRVSGAMADSTPDEHYGSAELTPADDAWTHHPDDDTVIIHRVGNNAEVPAEDFFEQNNIERPDDSH